MEGPCSTLAWRDNLCVSCEKPLGNVHGNAKTHSGACRTQLHRKLTSTFKTNQRTQRQAAKRCAWCQESMTGVSGLTNTHPGQCFQLHRRRMRKPHEIRVDAQRKAERDARKANNRCTDCDVSVAHLKAEAIRCSACRRKHKDARARELDLARNPRRCRDCGTEFPPKMGKRTCDSCANQRTLIRDRARHHAKNELTSGPLKDYECPMCHENFDRKTRLIRYCRKCIAVRRQIHATRQRAIRKTNGGPDTRTNAYRIYKRAIFDRDKFICHLCRKPTAYVWRKGDPLSPVLDHLIPLSHPKSPGHITANVATAHAGCNARKHNTVSRHDIALYHHLLDRQTYGW
jgi:5-methylcytosine-specific restriction endonuclease McrA